MGHESDVTVGTILSKTGKVSLARGHYISGDDRFSLWEDHLGRTWYQVPSAVIYEADVYRCEDREGRRWLILGFIRLKY